MTLKRKGKIRRGLIGRRERRPVDRATSCAGCGAASTRKRWLVPLVVFLCVTGPRAGRSRARVEALAPFIYAIF